MSKREAAEKKREAILDALRASVRPRDIAGALGVKLSEVKALQKKLKDGFQEEPQDPKQRVIDSLKTFDVLRSYLSADLLRYRILMPDQITEKNLQNSLVVTTAIRRQIRSILDVEAAAHRAIELLWKVGVTAVDINASSNEWIVRFMGPDGGDPFDESATGGWPN